jgi:iron complex transport system substrate-binding protein
LAYGDSNASKPAIRTENRRHPALRQVYAGREIIYPQLLYACGLPQSAEAAKELRKAMTDILAQPTGGP